jgi:uncharacterized protein YjbI with pentapeptide repeats
MEEITGEEFVNRLYHQSITEHKNLKIIVPQAISINLSKTIKYIVFRDIEFIGDSISFYNTNKEERVHHLNFIDCDLESNINFENCKIEKLKFYSTLIKCQQLKIKNCEIYENSIKNSTFNNSKFIIANSTTIHLDFERINMIESKLLIESSIFPNAFSISQSSFKILRINNSKFLKYFDFIANKSIDEPGSQAFLYNEFNQTSFFETSFNKSAEFLYSTFSGTCNFTGIRNHPSSIVKFVECSFDKSVHFDKVNLSKISFENVKFNEIVSFQESILGTMFIDKTLFEKAAHFDDIIIKEKRKTDRRTLRNIKQQLQKAENKIDYNRFRGYELGAYYRELKWRGDFKDKFILAATWLSTGFDHSWRRALAFTIISGSFFYTLLYFNEFYIALNLNGNNNFTQGLFRFFLVTDFFSPFLDRQYLNNSISWIIFIFGKIVIAFGIYEMIQAFRKFKA